MGIEDSLVAIRRQNGQLAEKLLTDRARRDAGLCTAEHPVHVGERGACGVGGAGIGVGGAGIVLLMPFGALDRRRVFADQIAHLGLLRQGMPTVCRYIVVNVDASFATFASAEENCSQATTMVNPKRAP